MNTIQNVLGCVTIFCALFGAHYMFAMEDPNKLNIVQNNVDQKENDSKNNSSATSTDDFQKTNRGINCAGNERGSRLSTFWNQRERIIVLSLCLALDAWLVRFACRLYTKYIVA